MDLHTCRWISSQQMCNHFTSMCIPESNESVPLILSSFVWVASHPELKRHFHVLGRDSLVLVCSLSAGGSTDTSILCIEKSRSLTLHPFSLPYCNKFLQAYSMDRNSYFFSSSHRFEAWNWIWHWSDSSEERQGKCSCYHQCWHWWVSRPHLSSGGGRNSAWATLPSLRDAGRDILESSWFDFATFPLKEMKKIPHKGHDLWIWLLFPVPLNVVGVSSPGELFNDNHTYTDHCGHPLSVRVSGRNGNGQNVDVTKSGCSTPVWPSNPELFTRFPLFPGEWSEGFISSSRV